MDTMKFNTGEAQVRHEDGVFRIHHTNDCQATFQVIEIEDDNPDTWTEVHIGYCDTIEEGERLIREYCDQYGHGLTIDLIGDAISSSHHWLNSCSIEAGIVREAIRRGYLERYSVTQVQWTTEGLEKAWKEIPPGERVIDFQLQAIETIDRSNAMLKSQNLDTRKLQIALDTPGLHQDHIDSNESLIKSNNKKRQEIIDRITNMVK